MKEHAGMEPVILHKGVVKIIRHRTSVGKKANKLREIMHN